VCDTAQARIVVAREIVVRLCYTQKHVNPQEFPMKMFSRRSARPASNGYSVIDEHMTIAGDLATDGTVRVDGRIEGSLHRTDTMIIGDGASVVGNVEAREVVIGGEITGNLRASGRVEVQPSGIVRGDIHAPAVLLAEGGTVHGHVIVRPLDTEAMPIEGARRLVLTPSHAIAAVAQS
jgi:cytoskeletal protein CcmA (bactofilin family)